MALQDAPQPGQPFNPSYGSCGFFANEVVDRRKDLTDGQKRLYSRLVRWAAKNGMCWHSYETMAEELGKSRRQIIRDMKRLKEYGLILPQKRSSDGAQQSNIYVFLWHPMFAAVEPAGVVTSVSPGGDIHDTGVVTSVSPESLTESFRESVATDSDVPTMNRKNRDSSLVQFTTSHPKAKAVIEHLLKGKITEAQLSRITQAGGVEDSELVLAIEEALRRTKEPPRSLAWFWKIALEHRIKYAVYPRPQPAADQPAPATDRSALPKDEFDRMTAAIELPEGDLDLKSA